jgi:hypothetical protein
MYANFSIFIIKILKTWNYFRFVDIIHTDKELGLEKDIGHVDFYPNNGRAQPSKYSMWIKFKI